jgi:hypothetical protein
MQDGSTRALTLTARYGLEGDAFCLRSVGGAVIQLGTAGWIRAEPGATDIDGTARLREGIAPVRCHAVGQ